MESLPPERDHARDPSDEGVPPDPFPPPEAPSGPAPSGPEADSLRPLWGRLVQIFVTPGALFRALRDRPVALGALILGALLVALGNAAIPLEVFEEGMRAQLMEAGQDLPGDPAVMARVGKVAGIFGAFVAWPILGVIAAGITSLVFLFGLGYGGSYRQHLSVTAHAFLVAAVGALALTPLKILTGDPTFALTVGNFFFFLEEGLLARFLGLLDLFNLWAYVLLGVGVAAVDGSRSPVGAVSVVMGVAVAFSLLAAALTG